jgi:ATP-dependent DNA helicase RecG
VSLALNTPVRFVKRVGDRIADQLLKRQIATVEDFLYHLPFRYEDRLNPRPIAEMQPGDMASLVGDVRGSQLLTTRAGAMFQMTLGLAAPGVDLSGGQPRVGQSVIQCIWFNGAYLRERFKLGAQVAVYGKLELSRSGGNGRFKLMQPQFEILQNDSGATKSEEDAEFARMEMQRIVPVYESLGAKTPWGGKLTSKWNRRVIWSMFAELAEANAEPEETLPEALRTRLGMPGRLEALRDLHFPPAGTSLEDLQAGHTPAHRRLAFEEFWYLELGLELKRRRLRDRAGTAFATGPNVRMALKNVLPFHPTAAQKRVLAEIVTDMRAPQPMRRLLQGDVGSGKTIVAMQAALVAIENGFQAALMAPTEILATQHYLSARKLLADKVSPHTGRPYRITLLTGSLDEAHKREARGRIFRAETDLAIGTHALIQEKVAFGNLGLVIVDEQHRFGVEQRFKLMRAGAGSAAASGEKDTNAPEPDTLVMTATPIPRTLALTVYGDMDLSVIDELPPGRTPIVTRRAGHEKDAQVWEFVRKQVTAGQQAYIVYPVIEGITDDQPELDFAPLDADEATAPEETKMKPKKGPKKTPSLFPKPKLRSAVEMYEELRHGPLHGLRVGLLHGRMNADDKEIAMRRFQRGETDVLIATTVIEVGVDVPNASLMVIEHAERFGLAQMHQLRGRVGRGAAKSFCVLMTGGKISPDAEARLEAMVRTGNGFELAELDLQLRGPGEFFGTRQAGMPEFRVADLRRDREVLELAKTEAHRFAEAPDPAMSAEEIAAVWKRLREQWQRRYGLVEA